MDEEENIENKLRTVKQCQNFGAQRLYCKVINSDGGGVLCSYHDETRISDLKTQLEKIKQAKAEKKEQPQLGRGLGQVHQQNQPRKDVFKNQALGRSNLVPQNHPQLAGRGHGQAPQRAVGGGLYDREGWGDPLITGSDGFAKGEDLSSDEDD